MRAVLITDHQAPPTLAERAAPQAGDGTLIELHAAGLNPVDVAIASGSFPAGSPHLPYVPGVEGVGTVVASERFAPGTRVYATGRGLGVTRDGTLSEHVAAPDEALVEVPDQVDDVDAAALGQAGLAGWLPLAWRAPVREGESVLILGATGAVGTVAVQAAKLLGAGRVVAAGRDAARLARARALGADATVELSGDDARQRLADAVAEDPPTWIFDALWGGAIEAAVAVAGIGARVVHLGQSAGPTATLPSGAVRGKQLELYGYSNFAVPADAFAAAYREVTTRAARGEIVLATQTMPLERAADAWRAVQQGASAKIVLVAKPDGGR